MTEDENKKVGSFALTTAVENEWRARNSLDRKRRKHYNEIQADFFKKFAICCMKWERYAVI